MQVSCRGGRTHQQPSYRHNFRRRNTWTKDWLFCKAPWGSKALGVCSMTGKSVSDPAAFWSGALVCTGVRGEWAPIQATLHSCTRCQNLESLFFLPARWCIFPPSRKAGWWSSKMMSTLLRCWELFAAYHSWGRVGKHWQWLTEVHCKARSAVLCTFGMAVAGWD